jgi:hypothetical protein
MKKDEIFITIFLFTAFLIPLYQISKYGLSGYYQKKTERRQQRGQQMMSLFT